MGPLQCRVFLFSLYYKPSVFGAAGLSERTREACSNTHFTGGGSVDLSHRTLKFSNLEEVIKSEKLQWWSSRVQNQF